jgi:4-hydroxybenzoate polyprenyltransferase
VKTSISQYLSLVKFSHTIFALPFAMVGFFLALKTTHLPFEWSKLLFVVLCMVFARNAAMAFNRYADRDIDELNPRTKVREIPAGIIKPSNALSFVLINCLLFVASTYFINQLCFYLSPVALLVVLGYSITKRFTWLCHLVLGVGLSLAPIGAYIAVTNEFHMIPICISAAVLFWVSGFDIIYALQDEEFDKGQKLNSIPVKMGRVGALQFSRVLHILSASSLFMAGFLMQAEWLYWIGYGVFISLLIYQHTLVKPNDLTKVNLAFFTTNGIASVIFATFFLLNYFIL